MKSQILLSRKNKKKYFKMLSAEVLNIMQTCGQNPLTRYAIKYTDNLKNTNSIF